MNKTSYMHFWLGRGRITCAIEHPVNCSDEQALVKVGLSFCSPKDPFNRKRGRTISVARLAKHTNNYLELMLNPKVSYKTQVYDIIQELVFDADFAITEKVVFNATAFPSWTHKEPLLKTVQDYNSYSQDLDWIDLPEDFCETT